jgi:hypothetical protein
LRALLNGEFSADTLARVVEAMAAEVGVAASRNFTRWTQTPPRDNSYAAEIALLKDFLRVSHCFRVTPACSSTAAPGDRQPSLVGDLDWRYPSP